MSSLKHTTLKTILYRLCSWISTTVLAWLIIGLPIASGQASVEVIAKATLMFSVVDMVANTALYFGFERACVAITKAQERKNLQYKRTPIY